ncbi:uncharacterized protein LOC130744668 [Lotus japonicus]|uniref:uncharacterized protein LOC130744668 n=1 Tax=Lotus japonicus TaxID=34305 RepID=UPI00258A62D9|nr:uncharacterized protein LOC130744668 [Lotus japonicus]
MSQVSGKKETVKGKIEKTYGGVKVMGLKASSSAQSKKVVGTKSRASIEKHLDTTVSEDVSIEDSPAIGEPDVKTSALPSDDSRSDESAKKISPDVSSSSKDSDSESEDTKEVSSEESTKALPTVLEISDDDDLDEVPLASVADRLLKRKRVSVEETPSVQKKKVKSTPVSYKSRQVDVTVKGKQKAVESSGKRVKKTTEKKKKVSRVDLDSDSDVEADVLDITASGKKKFSGKRVPQDVPSIPLDNVSFHAVENALKWKFVYQRRIAKEREIGSYVLECKEIIALITRAGLRKTVLDIGKCHERLVKEFLVNLSDDVGNPESPEFRKVFVRGKCVHFSPAIINQALGRSVVEFVEEELSLDNVAEELTAGKVKKWPSKKLLSPGFLSVKYAILNRIGVVNWIPSNHTSGVSAMLTKLIYRIGTEIHFDFGSFVFTQTLKHAETCAVKLPVSFPSLLTAIILKQHPHILGVNDVPFSRGNPITLDHRLFLEPHVLDIDLPSNRTSVLVSMSASGTKSVLSELEDISKELQETIRAAAARKLKVDALIQSLKEEAGQEGEFAAAAEKEGSADNEEEHSSSSDV